MRLVFRRMPGTVWAVDRKLCFTYAAGRLIDEAGLQPAEVVGTTVQAFLGTSDPTDPGIAHHLAALQGEGQSFEYRYHDRWYAVLIDPLPAPDGAVVGCVGTAIDITDRRAVEERLAASEARLVEAQRTAHVGSFEWDVRSNVVTWTEELHRIYGVDPGQFPGTLEAFLARVYPPDVERTRDVVLDACRRGGPFEYDHRIVRSDGSVRSLHTRGEVIKDEQGNATRLVGSCWDVTELAEATRSREELLRGAVFLSDASRLLVSLEVERALEGVARLALPYMGSGCAVDLFQDGGPRRLAAISLDPRATIAPALNPSVLAGNTVVVHDATASYLSVPLLAHDKVSGAITFCAPADRRYQPCDRAVAEELARRAALAVDNADLYRRAQQALKARDQLLSVAAHEIRGPLTSIHLAAQAIRKGNARSEAMMAMLAVIEREDRRLSRFVDELVDLGRFRDGRLELNYEPVSLGEVVRDVAHRMDDDIVRSGSSLSVATDGNAVGQWDRFRLEQVVTNLLSNALKYGQGRPIQIRIAVQGDHAVLTIQDRGIGIEPDVISRVFLPFERGVSERHYGGLGLGLHIVKTIVEAMAGSVKAESTPENGTVFTVELPLASRT